MRTTPYITGNAEASDRYANLAANAKNWRITASVFAGLALMSTASSIYFAQRLQIKPVFIEHCGEVRRVFRAETETLTEAERERELKKELAEWVKQARGIVGDWEFQKATWAAVYKKTGGPAETILTEFYEAKKQREMAKTFTIQTQVSSPLRVSDNSFRVTWQETKRDKNGQVVEVSTWEALLTFAFVPPQSEEDVQNSPLGLVVTNIAWAQGATQ